ncbi:hypothetical protein ACF0H5_023845 [Mactra antiquata]
MVSILAKCDGTEKEDYYTKEMSLINNVCSNSHTISLPVGDTTKSVASCARLCSDQMRCVGFFYKSADDMCVLCNDTFVSADPSSLAVLPGSIFYQRSECNGWLRGFGDTKLKIHFDAVNRNTAQSMCEADNGHLVKIKDMALMSQLSNVLTTCSSYQNFGYWTDGTLDGVTGTYQFSDGSEVPMDSPEFWEAYAPDQYDTCIRLRYMRVSNMYRWNDMDCERKYLFICEY